MPWPTNTCLSIALVTEETATGQVLLLTANRSNSPLALPPSSMDVASWSRHQQVVLETSINSVILALQRSCIIELLHEIFCHAVVKLFPRYD